MDNIDLSEFVKTKAQANEFVRHLASISDKVFETDFNLESQLLEEFGMKKRDKFMTLLREQKINIESQSDLKTFLGKLSEKVLSLPILTLTVAFEPKEKTLQALSEWFFLNNKKQVLFEITVDATIIAGATMTFEGKYVDYSIKQRFHDKVKKIMDLLFMQKPSAEKASPQDEKTAAPQNGGVEVVSAAA